MATASSSVESERGDLIQAVAFAQQCFERWRQRGFLRESHSQIIAAHYASLRSSLEAGGRIPERVQLPSANACWSCKRAVAAEATDCDDCGAPAHTPDTQKLRYLIFLCFEIKKLHQSDSRMALA